MLAHAMLSIPATKAFEIGSGFGGCEVPGSIHNGPFILAPNVPPLETGTSRNGILRPRLTTKTNNSGGIQRGITNEAPIYVLPSQIQTTRDNWASSEDSFLFW
jgi:chorismate synthase